MNATVSGPDARCLVQEFAQGATQRILVEIARADDIEAGCLQGLCDQAGIIGGCRQRAGPIGGIADDERNAFFS